MVKKVDNEEKKREKTKKKKIEEKKVKGEEEEKKKTKPTETLPEKEIKAKDEVVYTIPLREAFYVERTRRAKKAVNIIREFLMRHKKVDFEKIKIDNSLNESLWKRSREKPPRRVKVKAWKEDELLKVALAD